MYNRKKSRATALDTSHNQIRELATFSHRPHRHHLLHPIYIIKKNQLVLGATKVAGKTNSLINR